MMNVRVRWIGAAVILSCASPAFGQAGPQPVAPPKPVQQPAAAPPAPAAPAPPAQPAAPAQAPAEQPAVAPPVAEPPAAVPTPAPEPQTAPAAPVEQTAAAAPEPPVPIEEKPAEKAEEKPWYEKYKLKGYAQVRYNNFPTFDHNEALQNSQGDRSIGGDAGFYIRRARLALSGDITDWAAMYLQADFAGVVGSSYNVAVMRDWYFDIYLTSGKELRLRVGQSKVPYGFDNLQSSQVRVPFDRSDAINSAQNGERDVGLFAYWTPEHIHKRFKHLVDAGLKGTGDYGVVGVGIYNGQGANTFDTNGDFDFVGRVTYPFELGSQFLELGTAAYWGHFQVTVQDEDGVVYTSSRSDNNFRDGRVEATAVLYPKPIGIQAEYNIGTGPSLSDEDPTVVELHRIHGGYVLLTVKIDEPLGTVALIPYCRGQLYDGGKKFEANAPLYDVREIETGIEWQIIKPLEITAAYTFANRTSPKAPYDQEQGQLARLQVQVNY